MKQKIKYLLFLVTWMVFVFPTYASGAGEPMTTADEYALKAVCLYNFTQFTRWPETSDLEGADSIVVGVVGDSPFGDAIQEMQKQLRETNRKNIQVTFHGPYREGMDLTDNHILFISPTEKKNMRQIIAGLKDEPVLTVSDANGFLEAGGMISLVLLDNRVRWEINRAMIDAAGLQVSAKLLELALRVENPEHTDLLQYKTDFKPGKDIMARISAPPLFIYFSG
jgi:hypothetical protein